MNSSSVIVPAEIYDAVDDLMENHSDGSAEYNVLARLLANWTRADTTTCVSWWSRTSDGARPFDTESEAVRDAQHLILRGQPSTVEKRTSRRHRHRHPHHRPHQPHQQRPRPRRASTHHPTRLRPHRTPPRPHHQRSRPTHRPRRRRSRPPPQHQPRRSRQSHAPEGLNPPP